MVNSFNMGKQKRKLADISWDFFFFYNEGSYWSIQRFIILQGEAVKSRPQVRLALSMMAIILFQFSIVREVS